MAVFNKRAEIDARRGPARAGEAEAGGAAAGDLPVSDVASHGAADLLPGALRPAVAAVGLPPPTRPPSRDGTGTVLAAGTVFEGTLRATEPVIVGGTIHGTLEAEGPVVVETGGQVLARVVAPELMVAGLVDGRVQCRGRLHVRATGLVKGKIHVGTLRIEEGALLDGQLQMAGAGGVVAASSGADLDEAASATRPTDSVVGGTAPTSAP